MNASRITALGLVAAATLWIASGHFLPHETAESRASVRPNETAEKLFRVGVIETSIVPHSRKLLCPAAPRPTARSWPWRAPAAC
jgi:multidrug efflux system membrane fusion protein